MNTTLPPSPVLVKEGVEGAPVGSGPVLQNQKPTSNTPLEADHPGPAELSPDQPTQTQDFGIGNILTEGTSDGDDGKKQEDSGGRNQTEKKDEEPWKLILGGKKGNSQNRSEERKAVTHTGKLTQAGPSRHPGPKHTPTPSQVSTPRPTYNQARMGIRGDRETQATPRTDQKPPSTARRA